MAARADAIAERSPSSAARQIVQVTTLLVDEDLRLDARYWQESFRAAQSHVFDSGLRVRTLGGEDGGMADVWFPSRFKRVYALDERYGTPFLRAHSVFYRIPESDRFLSRTQTRDFDSYLVERGWLLLACSGTLGGVAYVTELLAQFAITHDLVRIVPTSEETGLYLAAFLQTRVGQLLATHDEHGSAVPHISDKQAARISVPILGRPIKNKIVALMRRALLERERHTRELQRLNAEFLEACRLPALRQFKPEHLRDGIRGWELSRAETSPARIDAEFFSPANRLARELVAASGMAMELGEAAELHLPNRFRRTYVEPAYGTPMLGGRHIHQWRPIGLQYISDRSFNDPEAYSLRPGMSVFSADGRAQEKLGEPAYVTSLWDGWKGSDHLMRVAPAHGVIGGGLLYLALVSPYVQIQIRSSATGSVVDDLTPNHVAPVLIPIPGGSAREELDARSVRAFEGLAEARRSEDRAIELFEKSLDAAYEAA